MEEIKKDQGKKVANGIFYLKNWCSMVIVKTIIDLVLGFMLVVIFFSVGHILSKLSLATIISPIVEKASLIIAFCYLLAIVMTTCVRTTRFIRSDLAELDPRAHKSSGDKHKTSKENKEN